MTLTPPHWRNVLDPRMYMYNMDLRIMMKTQGCKQIDIWATAWDFQQFDIWQV